MRTRQALLTIIMILLAGLNMTRAASPELINYQARLVDDGALVNGTTQIIFRIYNDISAGTLQYAETQTVSIVDGLYAMQIGLSNSVPGSLSAALTNAAVYLETQVGGTTLSPRERLVAVPYALSSSSVATDSKPLELLVNGSPVAQFDTNASPNIILGRSNNSIASGIEGAIITGGAFNDIGVDSDYSAVGGGYTNNVARNSSYATIAGGYSNDIGVNSGHSTVGGGRVNNVASNSSYTTIAGGYSNDIGVNSVDSTVGGGSNNSVADNSWRATIAGGGYNYIGVNSTDSTVGGGYNNKVADNSSRATIAGGGYNDIGVNSDYSTVGGGRDNNVASNSSYATIAGGFFNDIGIDADYSIVAGGNNNDIGDGAQYAFAAGRRAKGNHTGAFVWGDSENADTTSTATNQFMVRASGGVIFYSASGTGTGVELAAGGGSWSTLSDRNQKENVKPVDTQEVLEKISKIPMNTWNYKSQKDEIRHMGPMAQDIYAAFQIGEDERRISTVDADGIALAAIQGLYEQNKELYAQNEILRKELDELKNLVNSLNTK